MSNLLIATPPQRRKPWQASCVRVRTECTMMRTAPTALELVEGAEEGGHAGVAGTKVSTKML